MKNLNHKNMLSLLLKRLEGDGKERFLSRLKKDEGLKRHVVAEILFSGMLRMSKSELELFQKSDAHIDDETLAAFGENALETREREKIQKHLQGCPECFENVVHLRKSLAEIETMEFNPTPPKFVRQAKQLATTKKQPKPLLVSLWEKMRTIRWPEVQWKYALPALAGAATIVLFFIFGPIIKNYLIKPQPSIKNYSMDAQLIISEIGPLGFVGKQEVMDFKGMKVKLSEDAKNIVFTWPEVAGAKFYHIDLIVNGEKQRITPLQGINQARFSYLLQYTQVETTYIWEISGKLADGRSFQAKAGFVRGR